MVLPCKDSSVGMDPPPLPSSTGRFRIRVQVFTSEHANSLSASPLRQFTIAKNPKIPLPDLTLRQLGTEVMKRYEELYPGERLFSIEKSQDSYGSDLYLDDHVRDVFEDNEVFRVIKGSTMRASVEPHLRRDADIQPELGGAKRQTGPLESDDYLRRGKRKRLWLDPDQPIFSNERDILQDNDRSQQVFELNTTVVPNSQRAYSDQVKAYDLDDQSLASYNFPNGVSERSTRDDGSSHIKQRKEQPKLAAKMNSSHFETFAERRRSGSNATTTSKISAQGLTENTTPLTKKLKRPSIEPINGALGAMTKKTLGQADIYEVIETDYEGPITKPKGLVLEVNSNVPRSSLGKTEPKWRPPSPHTLAQQDEAACQPTPTPNNSNSTSQRSPFLKPTKSNINNEEPRNQRQSIRLSPGPPTISRSHNEGSFKDESDALKLQEQQDAKRVTRKNEDGQSVEKTRQMLTKERARVEKVERRDGTKKLKENKAKAMARSEVKHQKESERPASATLGPLEDDAAEPLRRKASTAKAPLGKRQTSSSAFAPKAATSDSASASQPSKIIPSPLSLSVRSDSPGAKITSSMSTKRDIYFASEVPSTKRRSFSAASAGSVRSTLVPSRLSYTDEKKPPNRVSPRACLSRPSSSKASKDEATLHGTLGIQSEPVVIPSPSSDGGSSSISSDEGNKEGRLNIDDQRNFVLVKSKGAVDREGPAKGFPNISRAEVLSQSQDSSQDQKSVSGEDCQPEDSKSVTSHTSSSQRSEEFESETFEFTWESKGGHATKIHSGVLSGEVVTTPKAQHQTHRSERAVGRKNPIDDERETQAQLDQQILTQIFQSPPSRIHPNALVSDLRRETRIIPPGYHTTRSRGLRHMTEEALRTKDSNLAAAKERAVMKEQKIKTGPQRVEESSEDDYSMESNTSEDDSDDSAMDTLPPSYNVGNGPVSTNSDRGSLGLGIDQGKDDRSDEGHKMDVVPKGLSTSIKKVDIYSPVVTLKPPPALQTSRTETLKPTEVHKTLVAENRKGKTSFGHLAKVFQNGKNKGLAMASARASSQPD